ncbi:VPS10 domain-containing receptor SorCS1 [Columba guinea]|nr:VPS10 domain-containing receptor SorCS1 [Columba guinea]
MVLNKKSGQNRNLKTFIGLQGCGERSGQPSFFFWIFCGQKDVSDRCTNSLQKKLILKLIQKAAVILILTKLYDYNLGSITESSLWRSTDYGTTYEKLNDKIGLKTILSYLYVCPTNKRKIMLLTDPEVESSLLISSDEGATYQKYRLNFYIHSLLFHPKQEDWILAYSQDQKLFSSVEFGRRWLLLHEGVAPNRFYWSMMGSGREPDLVHLEAKTVDGHAQYITCKMQNCSEATRSKPFPGYIDHNSLIVQDDYVFVQLTSGGRPHYYVSYRRSAFAQMKLPKYALPKDMHVISTDENQVFAAVQEWNQNDTYNLYISDTRGVYFTLALENVKSSQGLEGNVMIDLYEVAGIKGMFLANKKIDNQVKTFITYNKGRDWSLLQAPDTDLRGNPVRCLLPYCSLHLHLKVSENPYTSGNIASRDTAPSIIVASGNIGTELSDTDISMFVSSDAGNTWRQIFEEEHSVLYLDQGGVLVAMKHTSLPIRHLWLSFDEGKSWSKYSFTSLPLFVDGVLGEPGEETLIMTVFGHFSHRSEWQLVKVDYKSIFDRRCAEEDYRPWQLHSQGEACIMGAKRIYRKRKSEKKCMQGKYAGAMTSEPCVCTEADFDCDYGYERHSNGQCLPAFWYNPSSLSKDCSLGQSYLNSTGYRKVVSNNCTDGVRERYTAKPQQCPSKAPQGLRILTSDGKLTAEQGHNVTFLVQLEEGDLQRSLIQVDFGDGIAVSYANLSSTEDGIKHIYQNVGIFRVTVLVENSLGSDNAVLYLHVTCPLEHVHLSLPFVTTKNKEVNATTVLWPSQVGTLTYVWWFGNNTEPLITLEGSITFTFSVEGMNTITVQVSAGNTILQDTKTIAVYEQFQSLRLSFSPNLDDYNPDIPEWRRDISRVVKRALVEISETLIQKLNQNLVHFELKPGVQILVHAAHLTSAPLVDLTPSHSGSAMLMLLSVVFVGLAVFVIYKFKRKIPGLNRYAQMQNEKDQEMVSPVSQRESIPNVPQSELVSPQQLVDEKLEAQSIVIDPFERVCFGDLDASPTNNTAIKKASEKHSEPNFQLPCKRVPLGLQVLSHRAKSSDELKAPAHVLTTICNLRSKEVSAPPQLGIDLKMMGPDIHANSLSAIAKQSLLLQQELIFFCQWRSGNVGDRWHQRVKQLIMVAGTFEDLMDIYNEAKLKKFDRMEKLPIDLEALVGQAFEQIQKSLTYMY